jgi:hypothetical protein
MKDLQPDLLNDYEHRVNRIIEKYGAQPDFPKSSDDVDATLGDYLFSYQAQLDSEGSARTQQTVYGIIALVPIIIISAFPVEMLPWESNMQSLLVGLGIGIAIALLIKAIRVGLRQMGLRRLRREYPQAAAYADEVLAYGERPQGSM